MRVKGHRIGTLETRVEVRDVGIEDAECAIGPIHMQPETLLGAEVGQFIERIHGAGIDRPGTAHHTERSQTFFPVVRDCFAQGMQIHFVPLIDRDDAWLSQSQQVRRLSETAMPLFRDVEHQWRMVTLQAFRAHIPAIGFCSPVASHRQAVQRGNGTTTDQNACAALDRKVDQFHQPAHHAVLQVDRRVISSGCTRIHHRGEKVCQHADGCACRVDPGGEARMLVAHGMRQDMLLEEIEQRFGRPAMLRELLIEQQLPF